MPSQNSASLARATIENCAHLVYYFLENINREVEESERTLSGLLFSFEQLRDCLPWWVMLRSYASPCDALEAIIRRLGARECLRIGLQRRSRAVQVIVEGRGRGCPGGDGRGERGRVHAA